MKLTGTTHFIGLFPMREEHGGTFSLFFYKNHFAYMGLFAASAAMALYQETRVKEQASGHLNERSLGLLLLILLLVVSVIVAQARAATLAMTPLLVAFICAVLRVRVRRAALVQLPLLATVIIGAGLGVYQIAKPQIQQDVDRSLRQIDRYSAGDPRAEYRIPLIQDTWRMIEDRPLWGWGIGSFIHIHPLYASPAFFAKNSQLPVAWEFAHCDILQAVAAVGFAGSALFLVPPLVVIAQTLRRARWRNRVSPWLAGGCVVVTLTAAGDMTYTCPAVATGFVLLAGLAVRYSSVERKTRSRAATTRDNHRVAVPSAQSLATVPCSSTPPDIETIR